MDIMSFRGFSINEYNQLFLVEFHLAGEIVENSKISAHLTISMLKSSRGEPPNRKDRGGDGLVF